MKIIENIVNNAIAQVIAENIFNAKWDKNKHPRYPKGTPKGGQFAKVYTAKDNIPSVDEVIGLRSALNTNLTEKDCENVLKWKRIDFEYASAKFEILIKGYDDYKICSIIIID